MKNYVALLIVSTAASFAWLTPQSRAGQTPVAPIATPGAAAPGGGTYSGVDFTAPRTFPSGEFAFVDANTGPVVGFPGSLARLNVSAATVAGLNLAAGESIVTNGGILALANPSPGNYLVQVKIATGSFQQTAFVRGTPGNFTKLIRTGDPLPGTTATWTPTRTSPTFFAQQDLPTTRNGDPMIKALNADNTLGYIGIYRNGAWENTQITGINAPGFPAGTGISTAGIAVRAGNSAGQFVFDTSSLTGVAFGTSAAYMGQNGTLQLMMKTGDVLPGDPRPVAGSLTVNSINNAGTAVIAGFYAGSSAFVYRWSAAGGATKIITRGDPLPSIGPNASFRSFDTFYPPVINASGAVLFRAEVALNGPNDGSTNANRSAILYQSAPGAPVVKVTLDGDTLPGLPSGTVISAGLVYSLNDAGQIIIKSVTRANTAAASRSGSNSSFICGGLAPNVEVIAREDTPLPIDGLSGSRTMLGLQILLDSDGITMSNQGEFAFRGSIGDGFFGQSSVFRARIGATQTSPLLAQSITFPPPFKRPATAGMLTLSATASSGLPVTITRVSGPATLSGNVLTFSGVTGDVIVRATQAGNGTYLAAETIDRTIKVSSAATDIPALNSSTLSPVLIPGRQGPGAIYSGNGPLADSYTPYSESFFTSPSLSRVFFTGSSDPLIFPDGTVNFKDTLTNDVISTPSGSVRLNFSSSTTTGVTALPGEVLDASTATVTGILPSGQLAIRAVLRTPGSQSTEKMVLAVGTPGNFTKILQTGEVLPGTTSLLTTLNFGSVIPSSSTTGGQPWVYAVSANGLSSHIGIYRNGVWETTQILGVTPPGYNSGTKFANPKFINANAAGEFIFSSGVQSGTTNLVASHFYGKNGIVSRIANAGTNSFLPGDTRQIGSIDARCINANGEVILHGLYSPVSGNSAQGGYVYRWTPAGGASSVLKRGDVISAIGPNVVFDQASRAPLLNNSGQIVILANIADRDPVTNVLSNFRSAILTQASAGAAIEKVFLQGESVAGAPAGFGNLLSGLALGTIHLNHSGQIALLAKQASSRNIIFGGTLPNIAFTMVEGPHDITDYGTLSITFTNPTSANGADTVTGEPSARLSNAGDFLLQTAIPLQGIITNTVGILKANVGSGLPPAPVAQTIAFATLPDRLINSSATLSATASSGLPISFNIVSGSASLSGNTLTSGATVGLVTVRATQAGNASYLAAAPLEQTFRVVATSSELAMTNYLGASGVSPADRLPGLDLDGDGLANLLEFALGSNPRVADSTAFLPNAQIVNGVLRFTFFQANPAAVNYTVTGSIDLADLWSASGITTTNTGGLVVATVPMADTVRRFLRLEVTLKP